MADKCSAESNYSVDAPQMADWRTDDANKLNGVRTIKYRHNPCGWYEQYHFLTKSKLHTWLDSYLKLYETKNPFHWLISPIRCRLRQSNEPISYKEKERHHLGDLGVDASIILKRIFEWIHQVEVDPSGGLLCPRYCTFGFRKRQGTSWVGEWPSPSMDRLCSVVNACKCLSQHNAFTHITCLSPLHLRINARLFWHC